MSYLSKHFRGIAGSPKPLHFRSLFGGSRAGSSYQSNTSELLQQLVNQVENQTSTVEKLVGGSTLGGIAEAAKGGFSWQSILKDVFPVGGLISGIAGLFESAPTPAPLNEYDAPRSLNFDAVLNANGTLSQGSSDQYGHTRASSAGLDLTDAEGGPYSPYQRAANGTLLPVAGNPVTRYGGSLNLPEMLQPLVQISPAGSIRPPAPASNASASATPAASTQAAAEYSQQSAEPKGEAPSFDQEWFNDHGNMIASAVRAQLLNYHPIVDTINDL